MRRLCLIVLLAACGPRAASSAEPSAAAAAAGDEPQAGTGIKCERERLPGSHIKREVCRRTGEGPADRDATERALRASPGAPPVSEGGMR